jgi:hypothetical protein
MLRSVVMPGKQLAKIICVRIGRGCRADANHVRKENIAKNIWPNTRGGGGDAGVPDGIMNTTVYTMSQTSWRTSKLED